MVINPNTQYSCTSKNIRPLQKNLVAGLIEHGIKYAHIQLDDPIQRSSGHIGGDWANFNEMVKGAGDYFPYNSTCDPNSGKHGFYIYDMFSNNPCGEERPQDYIKKEYDDIF